MSSSNDRESAHTLPGLRSASIGGGVDPVKTARISGVEDSPHFFPQRNHQVNDLFSRSWVVVAQDDFKPPAVLVLFATCLNSSRFALDRRTIGAHGL